MHHGRSELLSYRQLPVAVYHFQSKGRDEARPRAGLLRVREFVDAEIRPAWEATDGDDRREVVRTIVRLRARAREEWRLWLPHMPVEWGGMGLGPTAIAAVSAEAAKVPGDGRGCQERARCRRSKR